MPTKWPRTPTQKEGNIARQNKDRTRDKSGDGASLPKFRPPKKS
ncbi:MAG TPA: hypothetical protein VMV84_05865 [Dehalococcoidales bacterium]|nr:hypothetical protein [Dehalococcoidales bacterium]